LIAAEAPPLEAAEVAEAAVEPPRDAFGEMPPPGLDLAAADTPHIPLEAPTESEMLQGDEESGGERAPASSRRPVIPPSEPEERLEELAFGQETRPPLHTPPPESGRLPAAPAVDYGGEVTSVRAAPSESGEPQSPAAAWAAQTAHASFVEAPGPVADVVGHVRTFSADTFLELLDASLALGTSS
jgi:hypothetical protein